MPRLSKSGPETRLAPAPLLAREVAELHREKAELLEVNARLQKGLEFLLGRYFLPGDRSLCPCPLDEH